MLNVKKPPFNAIGDGVANDTLPIQRALDALNKHHEAVYFPPGIYFVSKLSAQVQEGLRGDTDPATKSWLESLQTSITDLYPPPKEDAFTDEPCLFVDGKSSIVIRGDAAELTTVRRNGAADAGDRRNERTHGIGILEVQRCVDVSISGLSFVGCGWFPPRCTTTGRAEKGRRKKTPDDQRHGGYGTVTGDNIWELRKNNSEDTSSRAGGFFHQYPNPEFPDALFPPTDDNDGGRTWGTFKSGYIGNVGYGLLIQNGCKRVNVIDCRSTGFNGSGFAVGFRGNDNVYPRSEEILFRGCHSWRNYSSNFRLSMVDGVIIDGCIANSSGHPGSRFNHDTRCDPGYGITLTGVDKDHAPRNVVITNCVCKDNVRKGIDAHHGQFLVITNNIVSGSPHRGIFAATTGEENSTDHVIVNSNIVAYSCFGKSRNYPIQVSGGGTDEKMSSALVSDNMIAHCKDQPGEPNNYYIWMPHVDKKVKTDNVIVGKFRFRPGSTLRPRQNARDDDDQYE